MADEKNSELTPEQRELRDRVRDKVMAEGWSIRGAEAPDAAWVFLAEDPQRKRVLFAQSRTRSDFIEMQASISVDAAHEARFAALPEAELEDFLWDLRFRLLALDVNFQGIATPLQRVGLTMRVYRDEIETVSGLPRALAQMSRAMLLVLWMINRKMNQPAPDDGPAAKTVN